MLEMLRLGSLFFFLSFPNYTLSGPVLEYESLWNQSLANPIQSSTRADAIAEIRSTSMKPKQAGRQNRAMQRDATLVSPKSKQ
jgi:hypothetical protein